MRIAHDAHNRQTDRPQDQPAFAIRHVSDGGVLYLQVTSTAKSWIFRYSRSGRNREMGLGSRTKVLLAHARSAADGCRKLLGGGLDPVVERTAERERGAAFLFDFNGTSS